MIDTKACAHCDKEFPRPPKLGAKQWSNRRFCSRSCGITGGRWAGGRQIEPRDCETCGRSFVPKRSHRAGRFCSPACYHAAGRAPTKATVKGHRMRTATGHPLAPPSGIVVVSRLVLYDKIGPGEHPCHWCGTTVEWIVGGGPATPGSLLADHVDWNQGNDHPENLVPSCNRCNKHRTRMGDKRLIGDDETTMLWGGKRTRAVERHCEQCAEPFLTIPAEVKKGKGRFCSPSCARRQS